MKGSSCHINRQFSPGVTEQSLTFDGTKTPTLVLAVVERGGAPEVTVFTSDSRAAVKPFAVVKKGQVTGAAVSVALDCVDSCRGIGKKTLRPQHLSLETQSAEPSASWVSLQIPV